jgi:hypothetical protein
MSRLWQWFTQRGSANCKPAMDKGSECENVAPAEPAPRNTQAAVDHATRKWDEHGDRADQDYYHVPGGGDASPKEVARASEAVVKAKGPKPKAQRPDALK